MKEATRSNMKFTKKQAIVIACFFFPVIAVFWLSLVPRLGIPAPFPAFDKVMHVGAYMFLTVLARISFRRRVQHWILYALIAMSVLTEMIQGLVPPREADPVDALANCLGIFAGYWIVSMVRSSIRRPATVK